MSAKHKKGKPKNVKAYDWFSDLGKELERRKSEISEDYAEEMTQRADINKTLISDFWRIWTTFNKNGIHFSIDPNYAVFAQFDDFPYGAWRFKPDFSLEGVDTIQLSDRTHDQQRIGDSLKAYYDTVKDSTHLRVIFEYCEGEHYYKYSGWKRIYTQHLIYDSPIEKVEMDKLHLVFRKLVKAWFESHLKRDRDLILKHLKSNFEKIETYAK
jgi:hypothetical protein